MIKKNSLILLGIDPGYDRVGWAIGEVINNDWASIKSGCLQTDKKQSLTLRYEQIINQLNKIIQQYQPTELAIESLFFFKNQKTALKVAEARGIILSCLIQKKVPVFEYTPLQIKQAVTGWGRSDKKGVEKMVRLELKLTKEKIIDDAMDALAIIITHKAFRKLNNL